MKKGNLIFFICCFIILTISCKKNNRNITQIISSNATPSAIITFISSGSGSPDSLEYLLTYVPSGTIQNMFVNPYGSFPTSDMDFLTLSTNNFQFKEHSANGLDYIVNYYTDANHRVTRMVDSLFDAVYQFNYNNKGYLDNILKLDKRDLNDTLLYAYYYYDASDNISNIKEYSYSVYHNQWEISADISIAQTSIAFPANAYSTFSIGRPFIYTNRIVPYQTLLFIFQTSDFTFNFGKKQLLLPSKFTNSSAFYQRTIVDSFSYTIDSLQRISSCKDHSLTSLYNSNHFLFDLKDTIIY